ncbi:5,10-methylene tetrahydromethanopterin reductase [Brucella melitensis]|uniref:5,10-methylene tetrahydromethanopterin reductase n=2 Tax=Brucella TaxID=234 RepID=A0AAI8E9P3_BRUSS|nr:hypothetical protein BM28_A1934 [Brucella melitensis M28]AEW14326.1 Coenzyme F420-dependent N(5),N(10)-methenyltetrahydromethanopterin dehydrogenase [Brucella canis HSK A52141]AEW16912.1 Coenzyme F420-dependent N(5),N(10)-methenyltetrahydromethanopterin dehydrogenase [Brucella abortus A13334]AHZ82073.1 5,10-methylene tetrahydromethanopterin reductase [Brucella canis]AIB18450.1 Hypothetical protein BSSP3_I1748 [Brucella suis bv. 2]AJM85598.1 5,10-methylene tetrahydromethanopterin reductase [
MKFSPSGPLTGPMNAAEFGPDMPCIVTTDRFSSLRCGESEIRITLKQR